MALEDAFPGQVEVDAVADRDITGRFEVTFRNQLVHSKATISGHGKCDSRAERDAVVAKITAILNEKK